jgi:hypothetical protein
MKKLLLILLYLPMIGFGQSNFMLGDYAKLKELRLERPKGSVSATSKLIRESISHAIDGG